MAYKIPRSAKGENRILMIFSTKALIYSTIGLGIGYLLSYMIDLIIKIQYLNFILMFIVGAIGFAIATFKVPNIASIRSTRKTQGENIDEVFLRWVKFKIRKKRLYILCNKEDKR